MVDYEDTSEDYEPEGKTGGIPKSAMSWQQRRVREDLQDFEQYLE